MSLREKEPLPPKALPIKEKTMDEKTQKTQENELVRLIRLLEEAGYKVVKAEIVQEPERHGLIDITVRNSAASYVSVV